MKKKITSEPKNSFVEYLTNKHKTSEFEINFGLLIEDKILNPIDKKSIKSLFDLILSNQIELGKSKRFPYDFTIKLADCDSQPKELNISLCIELFDLYTKEISNKIDWLEFEQMTSHVFSDYGTSKEISKLKLSTPEIKILFRTINGFITGLHPVCLNDMQLKTEEFIHFSLLLADEFIPLIQHDLIRLQVDQDGVSIRTSITKKTLSIIGNLSPNDMFQKSSTPKDALFKIVQSNELESVNLQYSSAVNATFLDFCALSKEINKDENLSLIIHGEPGTGKTEFAKQVAKNVNGILYQLNFPQIQSKWIGETEKNIRRVFNAYQEAWQKSKVPIILLINEADGLMNKRVTVNTSNDSFANQAQTELLEQLENFKGILIATTNLLRNIDNAFHRRFLFKTEILAPDHAIRSNYLITSSIYPLLNPKHIELLSNNSCTIADIKNLERKLLFIQRIRSISAQDIDALLENEGIKKNSNKTIGYMIN